jgi:hypothetical protein
MPRLNQIAKLAGSFQLYSVIFQLALLTGCSADPSHQDASWTLVPITEIDMVVGGWEGTVKKNDGIFPMGRVQLTIRDNNTYLFIGQSSSDVALGAGFLQIRDGSLTGDTDRRVLKLSLYDHRGNQVLVVDAAARKTGEQYHGEFTKTQ